MMNLETTNLTNPTPLASRSRGRGKSKEQPQLATETIRVRILFTTFHNPDNGYTVVKCERSEAQTEITEIQEAENLFTAQPDSPADDFKTDGFDSFDVQESITAVGHTTAIRDGDEYLLTGSWKVHPRFGKQFAFTKAELVMPTGRDGIIAYLASVASGVGPARAAIIYDALGPDCMAIIQAEGPEVISNAVLDAKFPITKQMAADIYEALMANSKLAELTALVAGEGVSAATAARIFHTMGPSCIEQVRSNPYVLADEVYGIGFKKADLIARRLGVAPDSPFRYQAAIRYALAEAAGEGHCYLTPRELIQKVSALLGKGCAITMDDVRDNCIELARQGLLVIEEEARAVYLRHLNEAEKRAAERLASLTGGWRREISDEDLGLTVETLQEELGMVYSEGQREAIKMAIREPICVITGGPGTGKSSVLNAILLADSWLNTGRETHLCAPTGRAAKRVNEITGREAMTIHRMLQYQPNGGSRGRFYYNKDNPLVPGRIVTDEFSMVDCELAADLLEAVPDDQSTQFVLVGDVDQLPSVGPGSVLKDCIDSGIIPTVRLKYNYRQAQGSRIAAVANQIVEREFPDLSTTHDFQPVLVEEVEEAAEAVKQAVQRCVNDGLGLMDWQVLAPMYNGKAGVDAMNKAIQEMVNPPAEEKKELAVGERIFREGDKVIVLKNDYFKDVFNGDLGVIVEALTAGLWVKFPEKEQPILFPRDEMDKLTLAYATSIHKSQGSQFPVVIVVLLKQHYVLLKNNLIYTAITRARDRLVLVCQEDAVQIAVARVETEKRNSRLRERLVKRDRNDG
jgi:exodeoxyribonuclease V alpha subunit